MSEPRQILDISTATIFKFVIIVLFFILLYLVRQVLYILLFAIIIVFILTLVIPFVSQEIGQLTDDLPRFIAKITASLEIIKGETGSFDIIGQLQTLLDSFSQFLQQSSQSAVGFIINIFGGVISFFGIVVISFYLSVMKKGIDTFLQSVVPDKYESYVVELWHR